MSRVFLEDFLRLKPGDIYLSEEYAKLYGEVFTFSYTRGTKVLKIVAIKEKIAHTSYYDLQSPYGYGGIFCNCMDKNFIEEALEHLRSKALKEYIVAFFIRFHPLDANLKLYKGLLPFFSKIKENVIVATSSSIERIRLNYSPRIRSQIRKARKELTIEFASRDDYRDFFELYKKTMQRNNAHKFYFFSEEYFKKLFKFKESVILKAKLNGTILAFACFFLCESFSYYHLSASTLKANASAALLDFFFEYASNKACSFCFLGGGIRDKDTVFNFKEKFSTIRANFHVGGLIFDEKNFKILNENFHNNHFLKYRFLD